MYVVMYVLINSLMCVIINDVIYVLINGLMCVLINDLMCVLIFRNLLHRSTCVHFNFFLVYFCCIIRSNRKMLVQLTLVVTCTTALDCFE